MHFIQNELIFILLTAIKLYASKITNYFSYLKFCLSSIITQKYKNEIIPGFM